ncbi:hypothetical protein GLYMA_19G048600v4 [Glycine max]|uniref:F-box domain-containing protein n=2 Tax=Glycine subgen. Soja TaxID=1462606 RepID=A0A0R0EJ62_SOYBN|nr:hypothetical protein GLYMA_19G048600v4 [Glycine max]RZB46502.1 F-box/kelch-repeat protein [Glycine soja]
MAMAQLPQDLIEEILSWLPVKSLMRFRCVSRTWNSLIFQAHFVKLNLQRSSRNTHVLLRCQINTVFEDMRDLPGIAPCSICSLLENPSSTVDNGCHQLDNRYLFIGSCNGLVCLINMVARGEFSEYRVWFCNLATRIMSEDSPHLCLRTCNYKLWWYQVKCGFGYDDRSDTYKVVLVLSNIKSQNREVRVHRLDLNKKTFKYLLMPNGLSQVPRGPELGVLKGCLCLSHVHRRTHFVVWLMREFGVENSWTQLLNVTLELLQAHLPCVILKPLCISENGDVLLLANYISSKFILYNKKDNRIVYTQDFNNQVPMSSHDYIQSLVLPYGN